MDRYGQTMKTYASASIWASVRTASGNESNLAGYVQTNATYLFTVRQRSEITEAASLTYNGNDYNIVFVDSPQFQRGYYVVTAERRDD